MSNIGDVPNRPAGTDARSIAAILADFDFITNDYNGNIDANNLATSLRDGYLKLDTVADHKVKWLVNQASTTTFGNTNRCAAVFPHGLGHAPVYAEVTGLWVATFGPVEASCPVVAGDTSWDVTNVYVTCAIFNGGASNNPPNGDILLIG